MAFYYGSNEPPKEDPPPGSWRETIAIILAVFKTLAVPLGLLFGGILALVFIIFLFTISGWLGLGVIALGVAAIIGYGIWEALHPPKLT